MDIATTDSLKEELINRDPEFRELAREHHKYEERLSELSALTYPSDEEQLEEITLKKKKLALKDQMYSKDSNFESLKREQFLAPWTTGRGTKNTRPFLLDIKQSENP
jgi:uncharacterized protein YdcH (DUF465 family)